MTVLVAATLTACASNTLTSSAKAQTTTTTVSIPATSKDAPATNAPATSTSLGPTTTVATSTTAALTIAPASIPVLGSVVSSLAAGTPCASSPAEPTGTITFVAGGQLVSTRPDGSDRRCLVAMTAAETGRIAWSSGADRVLLGPATVADANGVRPSGYFATNEKVTWSTPTGKALLAPKADTGQLIWRSSTDQNNRLDISFLQHTDFAAYHPSGKAIAASGTGSDGPGVYMATNRGKSAKVVAKLETPNSQITELGFSTVGDILYFVHLHDDTSSYHVHRLQVATLDLTDVVDEAGSARRLTVSTVDQGALAWQVAEPGKPLRVEAVVQSAPVTTVDVGPGLDVEPVGWLSSTRLVVRSVAAGASPAALGDLWLWSPGSAPVRVAAGVGRAAVRIPQGPATDPPDQIQAQAPG
jgi:hypothetical protein